MKYTLFTLAKVSKQQHQSASTGESSNQSAKNTDSWPELGPAASTPHILPCPISSCSPFPGQDLAPRARFSIKGPGDGGKKRGCLVLQTLAHRCRKTKIDLNLYRVKKITWEATGSPGEGRSLYRAPQPPLSRAVGNDCSSWIYISLFSALIISSDYLEANCASPLPFPKTAPHHCTHLSPAPTCLVPLHGAQSRGCNRKFLFFFFFFLAFGQFSLLAAAAAFPQCSPTFPRDYFASC